MLIPAAPASTYKTNTATSIGTAYSLSANWYLAFRQANSGGTDIGVRSFICQT